MSWLYSKPVNFIDNLVKEISERLKHEPFDFQKYELIRKKLQIPYFMMYSGHDSTIAPAWYFLRPFLFYWDSIPYASYIQI